MLTLTRKPGEKILISEGGTEIEIIVKEIRRNQVRLGIVAPQNVLILRPEAKKKKEQSESPTSTPDTEK